MPSCVLSRPASLARNGELALAGYANSFSLCTGYLCTARRCIACLLALSSYLENIISDLLFEIFFIKLGRGGKAPPRLASQASLDLLGLFNTLSWKIGSFSHGDNSLRFLLQNFTSQSFYSYIQLIIVCVYFWNLFLYISFSFRGPCVRKLLTGLIMYIYPLKIKNIVLYCIVLNL